MGRLGGASHNHNLTSCKKSASFRTLVHLVDGPFDVFLNKVVRYIDGAQFLVKMI
jgi:hypothetical protein